MVRLKTMLWVLILVGCSTTPTGRKQLHLLPEDTMQSMGISAFNDLKQKTPINKDSTTNQYVNCVAQRIIAVLPEEQASKQWEVVVFEDDTANAFALPGGRIGVHTGLLKVAKNQHQLAAVLGHEVGHVIAQHGNERVSQQMVAQTGMIAASLVTQDSPKGRLLMAGLGLGTQVGVLLPFSRKQESESDYIGLKLMAQAGFEPAESIKLWHNMAEASGGQSPPEFLSTHPGHETRIKDLEKWQAEAQNWKQSATSQAACPEK